MLPPDGAKTDKKTDDVVVELPGAGGGASSGGGRPPRPPKLGPGGLGKPQPLLPSLSHPHGAGGGGSGHHHGGGAAGSAAGPCGVPLPRTPARRAAAALLLAAFILFGLHRLAGPALTALEPARLRRAFEDAGPLGGPALYALAFTVGELLHVPGVLFVAAGVLVWGRTRGWLLACCVAPLAVTPPFLLVRRLGSAAGLSGLADLPLPLFRRLLGRLEARPLQTVALLRVCFFLSPPVTYALALSTVPLRWYLLGTAVGLVAPMALVCAFANRLLSALGYPAADDPGPFLFPPPPPPLPPPPALLLLGGDGAAAAGGGGDSAAAAAVAAAAAATAAVAAVATAAAAALGLSPPPPPLGGGALAPGGGGAAAGGVVAALVRLWERLVATAAYAAANVVT